MTEKEHGTDSLQEERVLIEKRARHAKTFDQRVCPSATVRGLNTSLFQLTYLPQAYDAETLENNGRSVEEQLASLGLDDRIEIVNRFNIGVRIAQHALAENGNPPAEFDFSLVTKFVVKIPIDPVY